MVLKAIIFLCIGVTFVRCLHLPSDITTCSVTDENFNECLKRSAEHAFVVFASGNQELEIPPLDPLIMTTVEIGSQSGPISIAQKYTNVSLNGLSKLNLQQFKIDLKACHIYFEAVIPEFTADSAYELKGQILVFPIEATGHAVNVHKEMKIQANATCEKFEQKGIEFMRLVSCDFNIRSKMVEFNFGTLVNGNDQLDQQVHEVINNDPMAFWENMRPTCEVAFAVVFKDISNKIFTKIPLNELFRN